MTRATVRALVLASFERAAAGEALRKLASADDSTRIDALGLGSIALLEAIGDIERDASVRIPEDVLGGVRSLGELVDRVHELAGGSRPPED